ncbi:hypothetical protein [Methanosphaera sp. WGK6]|uniref:hypothetical protein n=1 Tax=Methanosphaera sp. WGK6 TaxID=1561964 RepID=UPI00084C332C|nr:hypothetical protein [Methanosphaera sp. WGK6]OED30893.1 hypothetical protein NL43_00865 [Methanosphaera sp. WGK6]
MDKILDFNDMLFGDLTEYKKLVVSLIESLKIVTPVTFLNMGSSSQKGLSTIIVREVVDLILDSFDKIADNLQANDLISHEFPLFLETKEMVECLLMDPVYDSEMYLNLAMTLTSEFFTLLEVKLLLFDGYAMEVEAPGHVLEEYDKELDKYLVKFDQYKAEFIELRDDAI